MFSFYRTTIGKKFVTAVTGAMLFGFVLAHMVGNLKTFMGVDPITGVHKLDIYAQFLRSMGSNVLGHETLLWIMRIGLLGAFLLHVTTVIQLRRINRRSRPVPYFKVTPNASTLASNTMWWGGMFLLLFVVVHLCHLTFGNLHFQGFVEGAVYNNVVSTFRVWWVTAFYFVAMSFLALHLFHGLWSLCQTLGIDNPELNPMIRKGALLFSLVVSLGFISVPLAVFFKILGAS